MHIRKNALPIVAATAITYWLLFTLNNWLFSALEFSTGVNWVYLPSGLRLAFILIFVELGAVGIALASVAISFGYYFEADPVVAWGSCIISGFSPLLARLICIEKFKLDVNLHQLTPAILLKVSLVFSVISAVSHQLLFSWRNHSDDFISSTVVMAVGDFLGTLIVLYVAKFLVNLVPTPSKIQ